MVAVFDDDDVAVAYNGRYPRLEHLALSGAKAADCAEKKSVGVSGGGSQRRARQARRGLEYA
jgi:hypothetical protein